MFSMDRYDLLLDRLTCILLLISNLKPRVEVIAVFEDPSGKIVITPTKKARSGGYLSVTGDPEWTSNPVVLEIGENLRKAIQHLYGN